MDPRNPIGDTLGAVTHPGKGRMDFQTTGGQLEGRSTLGT
jgi:hypothetical protein